MFQKNWLWFAGACGIAVSLSGCRFSTSQPSVPPTRAPVIQSSEVNVSAAVPVSLAQDAVNSVVPAQMGAAPYNVQVGGGADNCGSGVSFGYQVNRGPVTLSPAGNAISATAQLNYWIQAQARWPCIFGHGPIIRGSCGVGEPLRALSLTLRATFNGIGSDWSPLISTSLVDLHPLNSCTVTLVNIDVTGHVVDAVSGAINRSLPTLDQALSHALNLHDRAQQAWNYLSQPIGLQKDIWLSVHPKAIGIFPLEGNSQTLSAGMRLTAQPELIFSDAKPPSDTSRLPAPSPVPSSNAFSIQLPVEAGYDFASEQISKDLHVTMNGIRYPPTGNPYLTITGADLYSYGAEAVLRIDGRVSGVFGKRVTVYLAGTPSFNSGTNVLSFPDLRFSVDSQNLLLKIVAWLEQAKVEQDLRNRMVFDLSKQVNQGRKKLESALNQNLGSVALAGTVGDLTLLDVYSDPDQGQFRALFQTNGTLNLTFH